MAHDQVEILLVAGLKDDPLGRMLSSVMGAFTGFVGVPESVIDPGTPLSLSRFNRFRLENSDRCRQKDGEEFAKVSAEVLVKLLEEVDDRLGSISLTQEQEQHGGLHR